MCEDVIRLAGACYDTEPPSGVRWLNDLPGLSLQNVAAITPPDALSAAELIRTKERAARRVLSALLRSKLAERRIYINRTAAPLPLCSKGSAVVPPPGGIRLNWAWKSSPLSRFYIERLIFYPASSGSASIMIKNAIGDLLFSVVISAVAGEKISVFVGKSYEEPVLFIEAEGVDMYSVNCSGDCSIAVSGSYKSDPAGFTICGGVECTDKNILCQFYECLGDAVLYQTAAEVAKEIAAPGSRFNCFADMSRDWAAEISVIWENEAAGFLSAEMAGIVERLRADPCFNCKNDLRIIPILPA